MTNINTTVFIIGCDLIFSFTNEVKDCLRIGDNISIGDFSSDCYPSSNSEKSIKEVQEGVKKHGILTVSNIAYVMGTTAVHRIIYLKY